MQKDDTGSSDVNFELHNTLVRDYVISNMIENGDVPIYGILPNEDYLITLHGELNTKVNNYQKNKSLENLADIKEIIYAIIYANGYGHSDLDNICTKKRCAQGGYSKKMFLIGVKRGEKKESEEK